MLLRAALVSVALIPVFASAQDVTGAGASFPAPIYSKWADAYNKATGGVTAMGMPLGFDVDVGRLDPAQPMPINLTLKIEDAGATVGFSGNADLKAAETADQPIVTGKLSNIDFVWNTATINGNVEFYGGTPGMGQAIILGIVWFWVIAWSSYFPEAPATFSPEYHDTKNDTKKAVASTAVMGGLLSLLLPLTVVAAIGMDAIAADPTYIAFLTTALDVTVGTFLGAVFTVFLCAGLLLSMNTATMDGSRALYAMGKEGLTIRWLGKLNKQNVPGRAMAFDMLLNLCLLFMMPSLLFTLLAGNIGYVLAHILALTGFLLLRRDRPNWPRPLKLGGFWIAAAWLCVIVNVIGTIFGVIYMKYTGYLVDWTKAESDPTGYITGYFWLAIGVFVATMVIAVLGFVIAQNQAGKKFSFKDPSDEQPSAHAYELMGPSASSGD